jgi:hypothetical protein
MTAYCPLNDDGIVADRLFQPKSTNIHIQDLNEIRLQYVQKRFEKSQLHVKLTIIPQNGFKIELFSTLTHQYYKKIITIPILRLQNPTKLLLSFLHIKNTQEEHLQSI